MAISNDLLLKRVLVNLKQIVPFDVAETEGIQEWFFLESDFIPDLALFNELKRGWNQATAPYGQSFCLIYCQMGLKAGVWLHYLWTPRLRTDYLPGCHEVNAWG